MQAGYNEVEDAESMRKFLCEFSCHDAGQDGPSKTWKGKGASGDEERWAVAAVEGPSRKRAGVSGAANGGKKKKKFVQ